MLQNNYAALRENPRRAVSLSKSFKTVPHFCYNRRNGGLFTEDWRKGARHEPIMIDLKALVPEDYLLRKIEGAMN